MQVCCSFKLSDSNNIQLINNLSAQNARETGRGWVARVVLNLLLLLLELFHFCSPPARTQEKALIWSKDWKSVASQEIAPSKFWNSLL